jgi:hypothetical protein
MDSLRPLAIMELRQSVASVSPSSITTFDSIAGEQ